MRRSHKFIDLTGHVFGHWTVLQFDRISERKSMWLCKCSCGTVRSVNGYHLRNGRSTSCGCHSRDFMKTNKIASTHGLKNSNPRLYGIWQNMLNRCRNKNTERYRSYGARGISVCPEWHEFLPFYEWAMASGYREDLTIDRINVDGNYEPSNCQWLTMSENSKKAAEDRRRRKNEVRIVCQ